MDTITEIAKKKGVTPSQLTLAWVMAQGDDFFPVSRNVGVPVFLRIVLTNFQIPGTTNLDRLEENLGSCKVKISKEEEQEIRQACEKATVHGGRYPEAMSKALFADTPPLNA